MRRVVVTGMGIITALGCGINDNWKKLISATSGISLIDSFKTDDLSSRVGGVIQDEIIDNNFSEKDKRKMDKFILYSLIATEEAIKNSGWFVNDDKKASRSGVIIGSGIGGLSTIYDNSILLEKSGPKKVNPKNGTFLRRQKKRVATLEHLVICFFNRSANYKFFSQLDLLTLFFNFFGTFFVTF